MKSFKLRCITSIFLSLYLLSIYQVVKASNDNVSVYKTIPFQAANISAKLYNGSLSAVITFSTPLDAKQNLNQFVRIIDEKTGQSITGKWILNKTGNTLYFPNLLPEHKYQIFISSALPNIINKTLANPVDKVITTPPLPAHVTFKSNGFILPASLTDGLPVLATNTNDVIVDFYQVKPNKLIEFLKSYGNRQNVYSYQFNRYLNKYIDFAYNGRFDLNTKVNTQTVSYLPISDIPALKKPGVYMAILKETGSQLYSNPSVYFTVSDIALHARRYQKQLAIYASHISSAKPATRVNITIFDKNNKPIRQITTDSDGIATTWMDSNEGALAIASDNQQYSILPLSQAALDLSDFTTGKQISQPQTLFLYSPRDIYRPGETVQISGILRDHDGKALPQMPLSASLQRPDGRIVSNISWHSEAAGYYSFSFSLPADAPTGDWKFVAHTNDNNQHSYKIKVEEFLPEKLTLDLGGNPLKPTVLLASAKDEITFTANAQYLYGAPAAGNKLSAMAQVRPNRHPFSQWQDYHFGLENYREYNHHIDLEDAVLDDQGLYEINLVSEWQQIKSPLAVRFEVSVHESGGRPLTRQRQFNLLPTNQLVGLRPLFGKSGPDYDTQAEFEVISVDDKGQLQPAQNLEVSFYKEERNYHWYFSNDDGWQSEYTAEQVNLLNMPVTTNDNGKTKISLPIEWGHYRVEIKNTASGAISQYNFRTSWRSGETLGNRPDQIKIELNKPHYQTGDEVIATLYAPIKGKGFVSVESDQLLWKQTVEFNPAGTQIKFNLPKNWQQHNIYLSALAVQPGKAAKQGDFPVRAVGLKHLPLDRTQQKLKVTLQSPTKQLPEQTLKVKVNVTDKQQQPAKQAYVTLAAVDVGVLNITNFITPDPHKYFFAPRRYEVDQLDVFNQLMLAAKGVKGSLRYGGDGDLLKGGKKPDTVVKIVSLFSGLVPLNEQGEAEIDLEIPDFNGKLRLMAVAFNEEQFGSTEKEVTIAAPVVTQLGMPRFLANGDQSQLVLDLHNLSDAQQDLTVNLTTTGAIQTETTTESQTIQLADQAKTQLVYAVKAKQMMGQGIINLSINNIKLADQSEPLSINREWRLGTRPAYPAIANKQFAEIAPNQQVSLAPDSFNWLEGTAIGRLALHSMPPLNISSHIDALNAYPYGCLEQTTSGIFPHALIEPDAFQQLGVSTKNAESKIKAVNKGISRILGMQKSNGSFGLWDSHSHEEFWLTAYATDFLMLAQNKGFTVPANAIQNAQNRLRQYVQTRHTLTTYYNDKNQWDASIKAYAGYVLAKANKAPLGSLRNLYQKIADKDFAALTYSHLAAAFKLHGDHQRASEAWEKAKGRLLKDDRYYINYGGRLRDLALSIYLANSLEFNDKANGKLINLLQTLLRNRQYLSTQERNALVMAGYSLLSHKDNWQATITIAGEKIEHQSNQAFYYKLSGDQLAKAISITSQTDKPLYASFYYSGYPIDPPKPMNNGGLEVSRNFYSLDGQPIQLDQLKSGDLVITELVVNSDYYSRDILVVDLLAAGLELENQSLSHSIKLDQIEINGKTIAKWHESVEFNHVEYRDDRFVAAINTTGYAYDSYHIFYLTRAVTPGKYAVPPSLIEDMYLPEKRAIGKTPDKLEIISE
ncbi:alpha-2-macroglobulin family protein [Spartinivicinus poritis]|uniref:Alpha-2-macroglobulin n=1 Tax=Spartinivicinus poritis TaxID=2994640 RepID=A0ABT5U7C4_9GAMM|nr:alpha-2-macroglobulin [Spartinivicinus sp. A2-2]MDE1461896.1 alpha-2-macroglobulin [Spartinivicinus sp. A2-2]